MSDDLSGDMLAPSWPNLVLHVQGLGYNIIFTFCGNSFYFCFNLSPRNLHIEYFGELGDCPHLQLLILFLISMTIYNFKICSLFQDSLYRDMQ